jgi:hypothetical protein
MSSATGQQSGNYLKNNRNIFGNDGPLNIFTICNRQKWHRSTPNLSLGDVLVKADNTAPLQWPIAVITEVHPGLDAKIRAVTEKINGDT